MVTIRIIFALFITMLSGLICALPIIIYPLFANPTLDRLSIGFIALWYLAIGVANQKIQSFLEKLFPFVK